MNARGGAMPVTQEPAMADKIDLSSLTNLVVKGAGTNLDNERTPGIFAADTPSNAPDSGVVVVEVGTIVVNGVRTTLQSAVTVLTGAVAIRYRKVDGTWTGWVSPNGDGATNLAYIPAANKGTVTSDTGADADIPLADATNAGLMTAAEKSKLAGLGGPGTTNLSYTASPTNGVVVSDTGGDATLTLADATNAGLMSPAGFSKLAGIAAGAEVNLTGAALLSAIDTAAGSDFWRTAPRVQIDVITSSGTYNIPTWAVRLDATVIGGGGGGGAGRRGAAGSARAAGNGGGAGGVATETFSASELGGAGAMLDFVIGAGGTGAPATTTDDTSGAAGATGGSTTLSVAGNLLLTATGGGGGAGGAQVAGTTTAGGQAIFGYSNAGGAGSITTTGGWGSSTSNARGSGGGGSGGGISAADVRLGAGGGGNGYQIGGSGRRSSGGNSGVAGTAGSPGGAGAAKTWQRGAGGGGGGGSCGDTAGTVAGGDGGVGGAPGGGGGGGGASTNGANGGAGADGARGEAWIIAIA